MNSPLTSVFKGPRVVLSATISTTPYTIDDTTPEGISVDASSGPITINLPLISATTGTVFTIRKIDSSANIVTISRSGSDLIEGATSTTLTAQWQSITIDNDGVQWHRTSTNVATGGAVAGTALGEVLFVNTYLQPTGTDLFRWDNTNQRLGIGTNTPAQKLHVVGAILSQSLMGDGSSALTFNTNGAAGTVANRFIFNSTADATLADSIFQIQNGGAIKVSVTGEGHIAASLGPQGSIVPTVLAVPTPTTFTTATTGGSLVAGTYYYRISAKSNGSNAETLASTEQSIVVPAGTTTNTVSVNWSVVPRARGYNIYGRTTGAELLIATISNGLTTTFLDTGSVTPSGALPTVDTSNVIQAARITATNSIISSVPNTGSALQMVTGARLYFDTGVTQYLFWDGAQYITANQHFRAVSVLRGGSVRSDGGYNAAAGTGLSAYEMLTGAKFFTNYPTNTRYISDNGTNITVTGGLLVGNGLSVSGGIVMSSGTFESANVQAPGGGTLSLIGRIANTPSLAAVRISNFTSSQNADTTRIVAFSPDAGTNEVSFISNHGYYNGGGYFYGPLTNANVSTPVNIAFTTATTGGVLTPGTYYYRVSATTSTGETLASTETSIVVPAGTNTNTVTVKWSHALGAQGYKIFGRTSGAELLIGTVTSGSLLAFVDTGTVTPAGALPTGGTTSGIICGNITSSATITGGSVVGTGAVQSGTGLYSVTSGAGSILLRGATVDGASAVAAKIYNNSIFSTTGSKLLALYNDGLAGSQTTPVASIDHVGVYTGGLSLVGGGTTTVLTTPVNATHTTATTGGSLVPGTYYYRVAATVAGGQTLASTETSIVVPAGTSTNTVSVNWTQVAGATGYKVFGRSTGAELLIGTITNGATVTFLDTGSVTPSGALPTANTTGGISIGTGNGGNALTAVAGAFLSLGGVLISGSGGNMTVQSGNFVSLGNVTGNTIISAATAGNSGYQLSANARFHLDGGVGVKYFTNNATNHVFRGGTPLLVGSGYEGLVRANDITFGNLRTPVNDTHVNNTTGGTLVPGTYYYRVSALDFAGNESLASTETSIVVPAGTSTNRVDVKWHPTPGAVGYKVYGRTTGAELLIGTVSTVDTTTFSDTGTVTPSGALPSTNATVGAVSGGITVRGLPTPVNAVHVASTTGGTLTTGTYYYRVSATNSFGESLASTETSVAASGPTASVTVNWIAVPGATGYKVYGRTTGAETLLATVTDGYATSSVDTGAAPSGALPSTNATAGISIEDGRHIYFNGPTNSVSLRHSGGFLISSASFQTLSNLSVSGTANVSGNLTYARGFCSVRNTLTALAGGGQAGATALDREHNYVTVVASAGDSVILGAGVIGSMTYVANEGTNAMDVFPTSGGTINGLAVDAAYSIPAGEARWFLGKTATAWKTAIA